MHPRLAEELLDEEAEAVRINGFLAQRLVDLRRRGRVLMATGVPSGGLPVQLRFAGEWYDTDPLSLSVHDPSTGDFLPGPVWPGSLFHSEHPVLHRPFCCVRGLLEYHVHPSHIGDPWDRSRFVLRFPTLLGQILNKAGIP